MAKYIYTALTKDNKTLQGTMEAIDQAAVSDALARQGAHPIVVKLAGHKGGLLSRLQRGKKVKLKDLVIFTRQLSTMISAGVPLTRALSTMQNQSSNKYFKTVISDITKDVEGGAQLGDALKKFPLIFNDVYVNMVRAGEAGGILDEILKRLALQVELDASIRKKVKSAMTYPVVIFSVTILAFFGIMIFVMPKLGAIIKDLGGEDAQLPVYTQVMLGLSDFMQQNAVFMIVGLVIAAWLLRRYIRTPSGKRRWHSLLLRIPVIKNIITKIAIARFARTFASLMGSGVAVLEALAVTGGSIGNKVIEEELQAAAHQVKNGKQLSEPLGNSKHFPAIVAQMLAIGEETGQTDTILVKVADFYEEEVETIIDGMASIIEPLMIIMLGGMVGLIAASVMGPIASLSKNIQQ
jgi:type IV pilus assembly protein PilC